MFDASKFSYFLWSNISWDSQISLYLEVTIYCSTDYDKCSISQHVGPVEPWQLIVCATVPHYHYCSWLVCHLVWIPPSILIIYTTQFTGIVFFTIRWWDPLAFAAMHPEGSAARVSWPYVEDKSYLWTWLFFVPLVAYTLWQLLYFLIVNVLRRQRLLQDPEVMTSYR